MTSMPSQALLESALQKQFQIEGDGGQSVPSTLKAVRAGPAMTPRHTCYVAMFELPPAIGAAQGTYRVRHEGGDTWELFMTPIAPAENGLQRLEAVFHYEVSTQPTM